GRRRPLEERLRPLGDEPEGGSRRVAPVRRQRVSRVGGSPPRARETEVPRRRRALAADRDKGERPPMANIKSAEKRIRQTAKRRARNQAAVTHLRTAVKKFRQAAGDARAKALPATYAEIDRALKKGVIHKNAAARYKSRLAKASRAAKSRG